jgi:alkaline phosphatase D
MEVPEVQTRRQFVTRAGTAAAAAVFAPTSLALAGRHTPLARGGRFAEGVMSGEPKPTAITLWTRLQEVGGRVGVDLEIARDRGFRHVVARERVVTSGGSGHAVKARVGGLDPYEQYFYRFATKDRESPIGRFRTALPPDSRQPVRFAFWSCQDYTHGFFNAHRLMARDDDLDFVVCLGDYIYADTQHSVQDGTGVRDDLIGSPRADVPRLREAITLADYRAKYALYRSDPALREVQARFPTVILWDDHEVQDNYAGDEAGTGGLGPEKRFSPARRRAGYRAFFESQPYFPVVNQRIFRRLRFGRTVDLIVTDQRQWRRDQPCGDAVAPACADFDRPRNFLGPYQMNWVKEQLRASRATWKIMANEVTMMPTKVLGDAYFMFDSWQGYPREREELLTFIRDQRIRDVVFVTGDIHTFIAGDVRTELGAGDTVALEFVGGSVTSQGLGETDLPAGGGVTIKGNDLNPSTSPALIDTLRGINPWVDQADFDHHGYGRIVARSDRLTCDLVRLQTIKRPSTATLAPIRYRVRRGQRSITGAAS